MGSRWCAWCFAAVAASTSRAAFAEDIGREPLAPMSRPVPAPEAAKPAGGASTPEGPAAVDRAPQETTPKRRWYGGQVLLVDTVPALGLLTVGLNKSHSDSDSVVIPLVTIYFLGGPVVHAAHGQVGKAFLSLGIRSIGPLFIALAASQNNSEANGATALIAFGVLAIPTAIAVDVAAIAREDVKGDDASLLHRVVAAPWIDPKRGAAGLAASLTF